MACKMLLVVRLHWNDKSTYWVDAFVLNKELELTSIGRLQRHDQNFGEFLASHKVKITDEKSARCVWDAFCDLQCWLFKTDTIEKVSDRTWRLGVRDRRAKGLGKSYYEVHLNEDFVVTSAKWIVESPERRQTKQRESKGTY